MSVFIRLSVFQICLFFGLSLAINQITTWRYSVNVEPVGTVRVSGVASSAQVVVRRCLSMWTLLKISA